MTGEPPGFPEFLAILRESRTLFLASIAFSLVVGLIVAFSLPVRYRATAILLPPDDRGLPPLTRTERESLALDPGGMGPLEVLETPAGLAARMLRSKPVVDLALARLGMKGREEEWLRRGLRAWVTDEKIVLVEVEAASAAEAAGGANAMGEALNEFNTRRRSTLARALVNSLEVELDATEGEWIRLEGGGEVGESGVRAIALRAKLAALGEELGRARKDEIDPRPAIEFLERAAPPESPSRPMRSAVVGCFLLAGVLGGTTGAFLREALGRRQRS